MFVSRHYPMKRSKDEVIIISDNEEPPKKKGKGKATPLAIDDDIISLSSDSDEQHGEQRGEMSLAVKAHLARLQRVSNFYSMRQTLTQ